MNVRLINQRYLARQQAKQNRGAARSLRAKKRQALSKMLKGKLLTTTEVNLINTPLE